MEESFLYTQRKKLVALGLFLLVTALMVGREDNPGFVAAVADVPEPGAEKPPEWLVEAQQQTANAPQPAAAQRNDPDLDAWYAEAGPNEIVDPAPESEDYLIDSTEPLVDAAPDA